MKIQLPATDFNYSEGEKSGTINGGTVWLDNIAAALKNAGHDAELVPLTANYEGEWIIIQSEWWGMPNVMNYKARGGKICALLGHFIKHVYPDPWEVKNGANQLVTMWTGECAEPFDAHFMAHGYSDLIDEGKTEYRGDIIWAGNNYQLRDEGWLSGIDVTRIQGTHPKDLFSIYRGQVCPNIHGDFQKGIVSNEPSRIADKPGQMINERFWNVLGCGGILITDWIPQMEQFFDRNDLIVADTKEEFQKLVNYYKDHKQEGLNKLAKARELVRSQHTYKERVRDLLQWCS